MRVLCPYHREDTPSCQVYSDRIYCFGCGKSGPLSDVGLKAEDAPEKYVEDLEASLAYIDSLPMKEVRGLTLPVDAEAYYIVWPCRRYYKKRYFDPRGPKYIGTSGHEKPAFAARLAGNTILALVEGELNALSLAKAVPDIDVISPGGASEFDSKRKKIWLPKHTTHSMLILMVDADKAGALAVIEAMSAVQGRGMQVKYSLMPDDLNSLLVKGGCEEVRKAFTAATGKDMEART